MRVPSISYAVVPVFFAVGLGAQRSSSVDVRYRVTPTCDVSRVQALRTDELSEVIAEASLRNASKRLLPPAPVAVSGRTLAGNDAQAAIAKYRLENPDKYYLRTIRVHLADGASATLTCFFDEDQHLTSTVMERSDGTKELNIDIAELPVQQTTMVFRGLPDEFDEL